MITTTESLIILPGNPWAKKRPRVSKGGKRTHQDPADKAAEERTRELLRAQWGDREPLSGNIQLNALFFRSSRQVVDLDNLLKHLLDSGNGLLWYDDRQVTSYKVELFLDREDPRTTFYLVRHSTSMTR